MKNNEDLLPSMPSKFARSNSPVERIAQCHGDNVDVGFAHVQHCILSNHNVLVLMRGLAGSGKSTLARQLAQSVDQNKVAIYSTDDYFVDDYDEYHFDHTRLHEAHLWNQKRANDAVNNRVPLIIIDNTNIDPNHMLPYARYASLNGYEVYILVPTTPWAFRPAECFNKSHHKVPIETLRYWKENYIPVSSFGQLTGLPTIFASKQTLIKTAIDPVKKPNPASAVEKKQSIFDTIDTSNGWEGLDKEFYSLSDKAKELLSTFNEDMVRYSNNTSIDYKRSSMVEVRSVCTQVEELALYIACSAPEYEQRQMSVMLAKSCTTLPADESMWIYDIEEKPRRRYNQMVNRSTVTTVSGYPFPLAVLTNRFPMALLTKVNSILESVGGNMSETVEILFQNGEKIEYVDNKFHSLIYDVTYAASLYAHIDHPSSDEVDLSMENELPSEERIPGGVNIELTLLSDRLRWREAIAASLLLPRVHAEYAMRATMVAWTKETAQAILDQLLPQLPERPTLIECCSIIKQQLLQAEQIDEKKNLRLMIEQMKMDEMLAQRIQDNPSPESQVDWYSQFSKVDCDRHLVHEAYPGVDVAYLDHVFETCNYDVRATLETVKFAFAGQKPATKTPNTYADYASRLADAEWPSLNDSMGSKNRSQVTPVKRSGKLTNIAHGPVSGTGSPQIDSASHRNQYDTMRKPAFDLEEQAREYKARAREYQSNGRPNEAFYYRSEALSLMRRAKAIHEQAVAQFMDVRDTSNAWNIIDVHGLHATEAIKFISHRLQLLENDDRWHKNVNVTIITGHGKNSSAKASLQPAVRGYLKQHYYCFAEQKGHFLVQRNK